MVFPFFDPKQGITVLEPPAAGKGYWAGGHHVVHDDKTGVFLMYYRMRHPRGEGQTERGAYCFLAESEDGLHFRNIWEGNKRQFGARSIEKGSFIHRGDGRWLLYVSYEDEKEGVWRIDVMEAQDMKSFDPVSRRPFLRAEDVGAYHVKDPIVAATETGLVVFANIIFAPGVRESTLAVVTGDGLGIDSILRNFITPGRAGAWDAHSARLTGLMRDEKSDLRFKPWYAFYDGNHTAENVCEESCGYAIGTELLQGYSKETIDAPLHRGVRYLQPLLADGRYFLYYEYTRPDGSHELRVSIVD